MQRQGVLQPVDVNIDCSPLRKRARYEDIRDDGHWSLNYKNEVILHEVFDEGVGQLEDDEADNLEEDEGLVALRHSSSLAGAEAKNCNKTETGDAKANPLSLSEWDNMQIVRQSIKSGETNYFDLLSDEVVLNILRWLPKVYLRDISLVCKRFYRLSLDECLWTRMDVYNRHLPPGVLGKILSKQVIILRLASSKIADPPIMSDFKAAQPDFRSRLMYLDLSMATISTDCLKTVFQKCTRLKKLSLENVPVDDSVLMALSANKDIEVINLAMCLGITLDGIKTLLSNCRKIRELNIAWTYMNAKTIEFICENLPSTLDRLNISGCKKLITDRCVMSLVSSCPRLRELDLSDSTSLTGDSVKSITLLEDLNFLALSRCYLIPYKSLLALKKLHSLVYLDIHGGYIDQEELKSLKVSFGCRVQINKFMFSSVARPTVGARRSSIWNMRVRD